MGSQLKKGEKGEWEGKLKGRERNNIIVEGGKKKRRNKTSIVG